MNIVSAGTKPDIIPDVQFENTMREKVLPFLAPISRTGYTGAGPAGGKLYYESFRPENAAAAIVISHGYSESVEKYKEVIYYFVRAGYQVYIVEHRGHGRSVRDTLHPNMIHVNRFMDYVNDLHAFVLNVVKPGAGRLPLYLYAHSMGGAIGALYLEAHPRIFRKAVLSAPMLGIQMGGLPVPWAKALGRLMIRLNRGASYAPGQHTYVPGAAFENSCSSCLERFRYYQAKKDATPLFQTGGSSYSWACHALYACHLATQKRNCARITAPVLVFQSARDDTVKASGIRHFVRNTPSCRLIKVRGSRHEIYNSSAPVLEKYYRQIFQFYQESHSGSSFKAARRNRL